MWLDVAASRLLEGLTGIKKAANKGNQFTQKTVSANVTLCKSTVSPLFAAQLIRHDSGLELKKRRSGTASARLMVGGR